MRAKTTYFPAMRAALMGGLLCLASLPAFAQDFPPLPPLPPLPGMEAPKPAPAPKVTAEAPPPPPAPAPAAEVASEDDGFQLPDFGLFDPAELPPPPAGNEMPSMADGQLPPLAEPSLEPPAFPEMAAPGDALPPLPDTVPNESFAEVPSLPDLPSFSDAATHNEVPLFPETDLPPTAQTADNMPATPRGEEEGFLAVPALEDLIPFGFEEPTPPPAPIPVPSQMATPDDAMPKDTQAANALAAAPPAWMSGLTVPRAKPTPPARSNSMMADESAPRETAPVRIADAAPSEPGSLAEMIDREMQQEGGRYEGDEMTEEGSKRVVWPRQFPRQKLPPSIHRKQYSNTNRHLPHATYQKEIEAQLFGAVAADDLDAIRALMRTGVPLTIVNQAGDNLLLHAAKSSAVQSAQLLLGLGVKPNEQDQYGTTALHRAVYAGRQDLASILLRAGANVAQPDMQGITPLALAQMRYDEPMVVMLSHYQSAGRYQPSPAAPRRVANYQPY